jgi:D-alanine-D-alanine ligase-like ATP-grasp enzyme
MSSIHQHGEINKKPRCLYCGNNPTPHSASWIDSTIALTLNPFFQFVSGSRIGHALLSVSEFVLDRSWDALVLISFIRFSGDPKHPPTERGKVVYDEAVARGWKMETAVILGKPVDVYRIIFPGGKKLAFSGLPRLNIDDAAASSWMDDKALLKKHLNEAGIPVSRGKGFDNLKKAEKYFETARKPVITKPRLGSRGRHTTTFIHTHEDFKKAFSIAQQLGPHVVVEEHLVGSVYRATMIDRKLAGVLAGDPPRVTGDGVHTVLELIAIKNETRDERVSAFVPSALTEPFLKRQGHSLEGVLDEGVTIDLTEKIGLSYGGKSREVTPLTHPKLREELERAARIVDDPILGFDFITTDVSADPDTVRWGIIECNALPFINLHHDPLEGEPVNVAGIFLDYIEENLKK